MEGTESAFRAALSTFQKSIPNHGGWLLTATVAQTSWSISKDVPTPHTTRQAARC